MKFSGPGGYPVINLGPACSSQSPQMRAAGATGLLHCPAVAAYIARCQNLGKKVMLSLRGAIATSAFVSDLQASLFAIQLWNLFGTGIDDNLGFRPLEELY